MIGIDILLGALIGLIGYGIKVFIVHKKESNEWKQDHSERLARLEQKIDDFIEFGKDK